MAEEATPGFIETCCARLLATTNGDLRRQYFDDIAEFIARSPEKVGNPGISFLYSLMKNEEMQPYALQILALVEEATALRSALKGSVPHVTQLVRVAEGHGIGVQSTARAAARAMLKRFGEPAARAEQRVLALRNSNISHG